MALTYRARLTSYKNAEKYILIVSSARICAVIISFLGGFSTSWASEQDAQRLVPVVTLLLESQVEAPPPSSGAFIEQNGLIVVEMESLTAPQDWERKNGGGAIGSYLEWGGANLFGNPGTGLISIKIVIENPGTYQFIWRNSIREGTSTTDANDSFLKILADNYYGSRRGTNSIVCPNDQPSSNRCNGSAPAGSSSEGWFKVYRSGGPAIDWLWRSFTSDNDAHLIYAEFDRAGEYEIQISARSKFHAIDRFVLFRSLNSSANITESFATDSARPESSRVP